MFKDSRVQDRQRTASSFKTAYDSYQRGAESWFDGSPNSIDRRVAHCDRLLHSANSTVARMTASDSQPYLRAIANLSSDREVLSGLRDDLLTGASSREDVTGPPGWRTAHWADDLRANGHIFPDHGPVPENYGSPSEWMDAQNLSGYLAEQTQRHPQQGWDPKANDYAAKPPQQSSGGYGTPPRVTGYPDDGTLNGSPYRRNPPVWKPPNPAPSPKARSQQPSGPATSSGPPPARGLQDARLSSVDRRWVTLEASKFVQANLDTLDDSLELATRAHNHASLKTSTFTGQRSAEVSRAFVATVTDLGRQMYRPPIQRVAAEIPDVGADEALWF